MPRRSLELMFLIALLLNTALLLADFATSRRLILFSGEEPRIAWSIATGKGFSSPFWKLSGPTAWSPPLQPILMAMVMRAWGISAATQLIIKLCNILFFSATSVVLSLLALRIYGSRLGLIVGYAWATVPPLVSFFLPLFGNLPFRPTWGFLWDASLATFLTTSVLLSTVVVRENNGAIIELLYGALWGVAALANPAVLAVMPVAILWVPTRIKLTRRLLSFVSFTALGFVLATAPWLIRNYAVFHRPVFVRSNFGVELRVGNVQGSDGTWDSSQEPAFNTVEWKRFVELGEVSYSQQCLREATTAIRRAPLDFVHRSFLRIRYFWMGAPVGSANFPKLAFLKHVPFTLASLLAFVGIYQTIRQKLRAGWLLLGMLITYPLVCYITFFEQRFRDMIEPEMLMLGIYGLHTKINHEVSRRRLRL